MNDKILVSRRAAEDLLEQRRERELQLDAELGSIRSEIMELELQLKASIARPEVQQKAAQQSAHPLTGKAPKGYNLRVIKGFFETLHGQSVSPTEVARKTSVGLSSVLAVFARHKDTFHKGQDGLWKLK